MPVRVKIREWLGEDRRRTGILIGDGDETIPLSTQIFYLNQFLVKFLRPKVYISEFHSLEKECTPLWCLFYVKSTRSSLFTNTAGCCFLHRRETCCDAEMVGRATTRTAIQAPKNKWNFWQTTRISGLFDLPSSFINEDQGHRDFPCQIFQAYTTVGFMIPSSNSLSNHSRHIQAEKFLFLETSSHHCPVLSCHHAGKEKKRMDIRENISTDMLGDFWSQVSNFRHREVYTFTQFIIYLKLRKILR